MNIIKFVITVTIVLVSADLLIHETMKAYGQTVDNKTTVNTTDFSINIPDNWSYRQASFSNLVHLTPSKYASFLIDLTGDLVEKMKNEGGAYAFFNHDYYEIENAPFDVYIESKIGDAPRQNLTIDGEPAVRAFSDGVGVKGVRYLVWHEKEPFVFDYGANVKDFEKYLPEFEQIVKSFKFTEIK